MVSFDMPVLPPFSTGHHSYSSIILVSGANLVPTMITFIIFLRAVHPKPWRDPTKRVGLAANGIKSLPLYPRMHTLSLCLRQPI